MNNVLSSQKNFIRDLIQNNLLLQINYSQYHYIGVPSTRGNLEIIEHI